MAIRKAVTAVVLVAAIGLLGLSIFGALTAGPADVPRPTDVAAARRQATADGSGPDFRQTLGNTGVISAQGIVEGSDREVKVGSRVPGLVRKIRVREGQRVQEGDLLLELASDAETAAVSTARADLAAAEARLAISSLTARRAEELQREGAISREEHDKSVSAANVDRAGVDLARSRLSEAQARLEQLRIKAPSAGIILQLSVRAGEYYSPGGDASLVTLGNLSKVRVRLDVDERFIGSVYVGQPGYVVVEAYGSRRFPGKVVEIAQRMGRKNQRTDDPVERIDTKIREVVMALGDDARDLVPGLRATGHLSVTSLDASATADRTDAGSASATAAPIVVAPSRAPDGSQGSVTATVSLTPVPPDEP